MAPADEAELVHMVATAAAYDDGPIAFRYPRGNGLGVRLPRHGERLPIGVGRIVREGSQVAILSLGSRLAACRSAAEDLATEGVSVTVADARFAKPLDIDLLERLATTHECLLTVEEGSIGGFGSHVMNTLANVGHLAAGLRVRSLTLPDRFIEQDTPDAMLAEAGLDAHGIAAGVRALVCQRSGAHPAELRSNPEG
jgi:1-deoxy-D-xylulose-5-phosphate synthase